MPQRTVGSFVSHTNDSIETGLSFHDGDFTVTVGLCIQPTSAAVTLEVPKLGQLQLTLSQPEPSKWTLDTLEQHQRNEVTSLLIDHSETIAELEAEGAALTRTNEGLRKQLIESNRQGDNARRTLERQAVAEAELVAQLKRKSDAVTDLESQVEQLEVRHRQLQFLVDTRTTEFERLQSEADALRAEHQKLTLSTKQLELSLKTAQQQALEMKRNETAAVLLDQQRRTEAEHQKSTLEQELSRLQKLHRESNEKLAQALASIAELTRATDAAAETSKVALSEVQRETETLRAELEARRRADTDRETLDLEWPVGPPK
jgi:chromosome segregation ATPase